jgi:hypothetical protein
VTLPPDVAPLPLLHQRKITVDELRNSDDAQLRRALELLEGASAP